MIFNSNKTGIVGLRESSALTLSLMGSALHSIVLASPGDTLSASYSFGTDLFDISKLEANGFNEVVAAVRGAAASLIVEGESMVGALNSDGIENFEQAVTRVSNIWKAVESLDDKDVITLLRSIYSSVDVDNNGLTIGDEVSIELDTVRGGDEPIVDFAINDPGLKKIISKQVPLSVIKRIIAISRSLNFSKEVLERWLMDHDAGTILIEYYRLVLKMIPAFSSERVVDDYFGIALGGPMKKIQVISQSYFNWMMGTQGIDLKGQNLDKLINWSMGISSKEPSLEGFRVTSEDNIFPKGFTNRISAMNRTFKRVSDVKSFGVTELIDYFEMFSIVGSDSKIYELFSDGRSNIESAVTTNSLSGRSITLAPRDPEKFRLLIADISHFRYKMKRLCLTSEMMSSLRSANLPLPEADDLGTKGKELTNYLEAAKNGVKASLLCDTIGFAYVAHLLSVFSDHLKNEAYSKILNSFSTHPLFGNMVNSSLMLDIYADLFMNSSEDPEKLEAKFDSVLVRPLVKRIRVALNNFNRHMKKNGMIVSPFNLDIMSKFFLSVNYHKELTIEVKDSTEYGAIGINKKITPAEVKLMLPKAVPCDEGLSLLVLQGDGEMAKNLITMDLKIPRKLIDEYSHVIDDSLSTNTLVTGDIGIMRNPLVRRVQADYPDSVHVIPEWLARELGLDYDSISFPMLDLKTYSLKNLILNTLFGSLEVPISVVKDMPNSYLFFTEESIKSAKTFSDLSLIKGSLEGKSYSVNSSISRPVRVGVDITTSNHLSFKTNTLGLFELALFPDKIRSLLTPLEVRSLVSFGFFGKKTGYKFVKGKNIYSLTKEIANI